MLTQEVENYKSMGKETKMYPVECPCCHQIISVDIIPEMEEDKEILIELAMEQCTCPSAQFHQQKKKRIEKLEKTLERSVGEKSIDPVSEDVYEVIKRVAKIVCFAKVDKATIHLSKQEKINLKRDKDNFLVIEREKKEVRTEMV